MRLIDTYDTALAKAITEKGQKFLSDMQEHYQKYDAMIDRVSRNKNRKDKISNIWL